MPLLNRFARLFTADLHAVLDRLEEPDLLAQQAVREMEEELTAMQAQATACERDRATLTRDLHAVDAVLARLEDELDLCFNVGHDELARSLVRRKLEAEQRRLALQTRITALTQREQELTTALAAGRARLNDLRQQLSVLTMPADPGHDCVSAPTTPVISDDEIEVALLRERSRRSGS